MPISASVTALRSIRSISRPGVATINRAPRLAASDLRHSPFGAALSPGCQTLTAGLAPQTKVYDGSTTASATWNGAASLTGYTDSAAAMTSTTMGEDSRAGCTEQESRSADNDEAANGEQSYRRQTARQDVAIVRAVLGHRYSFRDLCMHRQIVKIIVNNRKFEARHRSNHLNVILTRPDAHRHATTNVA